MPFKLQRFFLPLLTCVLSHLFNQYIALIHQILVHPPSMRPLTKKDKLREVIAREEMYGLFK